MIVRKIRIILAFVCFMLITLLFLDFTGTLHGWFGWLAKVQFLPAVLALNLGVVVALVVFTLLLGRVYCSVICPLGVMQDVVSWLSGRRKGKKYRFTYSPAVSWLRYGVLTVFVAALIAGVGSLVTLLAPYSAYGRIAQNLLAPLWGWGNNALAYLAERTDSYAFYETDVWMKSLPTFIVAAVSLVVVVVLAWRSGRTYCNTICPVGTVLGFFSRYSLFRPVIDTEKCNSCTLCSRRCKASCIDAKAHRIDYSRCVACMDCIGTCRQGAIRYRLRSKRDAVQSAAMTKPGLRVSDRQIDEARRTFLTGVGVLTATAVVRAQEKKVDGGLAVILDKKIPNRATSIVPPGAQSLRNMASHCTGCQLCVSVCPNGVLRPATGLSTLMQPEVSYERGYCRPECVKCSEVCPAGAILSITAADKSSVQVGHAIWIRKNCVPLTDGKECDNCARHCPTKAIVMIPSNPAESVSYFLIFPLTFRFLGTYQVSGDVENMITLQSYISTLIVMSLAMGIVFEIPVLSWLFAKLGLLSADFVRRYRKHAIVITLIVAAVITPTSDVFTLSLVALPMWVLYEVSIAIVKRSRTEKVQERVVDRPNV